MYEALVSMAWCIVLVLILMEQKFKTETMGAFVFSHRFHCNGLRLTCSLSGRDEIEPLIPALQSNWLTYHVLTCFLGYAAFAVSLVQVSPFCLRKKMHHPQQKTMQ